jgi:predicted nucleic acid-binding protein
VIAYVDTSALVKLVVPEAGTGEARRLWARLEDPYVSLIGYTELRAAVAAAVRGGRLGTESSDGLRELLEVLWARIVTIEVDEPLVRAAGELAALHGLNAADAIHLASALTVAGGPAGRTALIAFDARLRQAAAVEGFVVLPETA